MSETLLNKESKKSFLFPRGMEGIKKKRNTVCLITAWADSHGCGDISVWSHSRHIAQFVGRNGSVNIQDHTSHIIATQGCVFFFLAFPGHKK